MMHWSLLAAATIKAMLQALLQGGVPIEVDGAVLGAVGVSGVKASDDEIVALAGVNALKTALG